MNPQEAYNILFAVLRNKCNMTGAEHEAAQTALKTLAETVTKLGARVQELEKAATAADAAEPVEPNQGAQ